MHSYTLLSSLILILIGIARANTKNNASTGENQSVIEGSNQGSSSNNRTKRFLYYSSEQRLTLPPGTTLVVKPAIKLPLARGWAAGYEFDSVYAPLVVVVNFDDLGLTSEENPWALWPDFGIFRKKREAWSPVPGVNWAGGDREVMFQVLEDALGNIGLSGKACLLRAICEMFETPLMNHGFLADVMELFFSVSKSPQADTRLSDYLEAENLGRHHKSCSKFYSGCEHSLFTHNGQSKWRQPASHEDHEHTEKDHEYIDKHSQKTSLEKEDPLLGTDEAELLDNYIGNHIDEGQHLNMM